MQACDRVVFKQEICVARGGPIIGKQIDIVNRVNRPPGERARFRFTPILSEDVTEPARTGAQPLQGDRFVVMRITPFAPRTP